MPASLDIDYFRVPGKIGSSGSYDSGIQEALEREDLCIAVQSTILAMTPRNREFILVRVGRP